MELWPKAMKSLDANENSLYNSISEELSCIICFERMLSPKVLKCYHIFCVTCLEKSIKKNGKITCPACRKNTKVKSKDPSTLPTAFIIDRLNNVLHIYENQRTDKSTPIVSPKADHSPSRCPKSSSKTPSNFESQISDNSKAKDFINISVIPSNDDRKIPLNDGLVKDYHERKHSLQHQPVKRISQQKVERRHTCPPAIVDKKSPEKSDNSEDQEARLGMQDCKTPACPKDKHIYKVVGQNGIYKVNEDIELNVMKYCSDGVLCNSWEDSVHAILSDRRGRVTDFKKLKASDGGWLLLCRPLREGPFTAIVKVNEKPVTSIEISVFSFLNEPIEV